MGSCASVMMGEDVRIAKIMSKFELVKPSDAKPGLARVVGRVLPAEGGTVLTAPWSGRPCVYYDLLVEEKVDTDDSSFWQAVITEANTVPYRLVDVEGGGVAVDSQSMVCTTLTDPCAVEDSRVPSASLVALGARYSLQMKRHNFFEGETYKRYRATERAFVVGQQCAALGVVAHAAGHKSLQPMSRSLVSKEDMKRGQWTRMEQMAWNSFKQEGVFVTSQPKLIGDDLPLLPQTAVPVMLPPQPVVELVAPPGSKPGSTCLFPLPDGRQLQIVIPPGVAGGMTFMAQI